MGEDFLSLEAIKEIAKRIPFNYIKTKTFALADVAQWIEYWPANQRVTSLIPSQGTCLGYGPGPQLGAYERQPHNDVSLPLFLPPFPSPSK